LNHGLRVARRCVKMRASFMSPEIDFWQLAFFFAAAVLVLFKAWRGWRMGVVRQVIGLLALAGAYVTAILGGRLVASLLKPILNYPEAILTLGGGAVLGMVVFASISLVGAILFKKTSEQSVGIVRFGYGISGAAVGAVFGIFLVWIAILAVRLLGSVAETQIAASKKPRASASTQLATPRRAPAPTPPSDIVLGLAHMKHSLEQGTAGAVVQQVDPIPGSLYLILTKLGLMVSNEQSVERFLSCPGVKPLLDHPKISALQNDPEITRDILARNYFALLRNSRIVAAANDVEIGELMRKFEFEKALDYSLQRHVEKRATHADNHNAQSSAPN
jgi:hypothetical protein